MPVRRALHRSEAEQRDAIHRSLLTGLLGNVGRKTDGNEYVGARGVKFQLFPGSALFKARPAWVISAEMVETARLYGRTVGPVNPEWIERIAPHLLSRSFGDPYWEPRSGRALVKMKLSYHGLVVVPARVIPFAHVDPIGARNLFIHHALVEGELERRPRFLEKNFDLIDDIRRLEDKARRRDLLADAGRMFSFYDLRLPPDVTDLPKFEVWRKTVEQNDPRFLRMGLIDVLSTEDTGVTPASHPDDIRIDLPGKSGQARIQLRYKYEPGHPGDGVSAHIPLELLPVLSAERFDRLVPGYLAEKVEWLIRSLPKTERVRFVPVPQYLQQVLPVVAREEGTLVESLARALGVEPRLFDEAGMPTHLRFNFRIMDAQDKLLAVGRDLAQLRKELGVKARSLYADLPEGEWNRDGLTRWDFGTLPDKVEVRFGHSVLTAYPALVDRGETVSLRLLETPELAYQATRQGLRRLFALQLQSEVEYLEKNLPGFDKMALFYRPIGTASDLKAEILTAASERALVTEPEQIRTREQFVEHAREGWRQLQPAAAEVSGIALAVLEARHRMEQHLVRTWPELLIPSVRDVQEQLANLMSKRFLSSCPEHWLSHLPRFMKAAEVRLGKLMNAGAGRDIDGLKVIKPLWRRYLDRAREHAEQNIRDLELIQYRWMLEELRVSLFAQELKTSIPISPQRLDKQWEKVRPGK
jgi:ATP-dependent helicase HrpA